MSAAWSFLRRRTLTQWILFGMVAGALLGWLAPEPSVKPPSNFSNCVDRDGPASRTRLLTNSSPNGWRVWRVTPTSH